MSWQVVCATRTSRGCSGKRSARVSSCANSASAAAERAASAAAVMVASVSEDVGFEAVVVLVDPDSGPDSGGCTACRMSAWPAARFSAWWRATRLASSSASRASLVSSGSGVSGSAASSTP